MAFIHEDHAHLNKKAGHTSLPQRHCDSKRSNIYCNWMYRRSWSTNKGYMQNTTLLTSLLFPQGLVEHCWCPCVAKIEETPGQFIHAEHTSADHKDRNLSIDKQDFVRKAVKTAPTNTAAKLIKKVQISLTKQINPSKRRRKRTPRKILREVPAKREGRTARLSSLEGSKAGL